MITPAGSSPLARGLLAGGGGLEGDGGIIPARAGFTFIIHIPGNTLGDHPRSRGVYCAANTSLKIADGSSPLARGLRRIRLTALMGLGIIPARAGFTRDYTIRTSQKKDHPRSRGVYTAVSRYSPASSGSSPLARGLPSLLDRLRDLDRIIPARAGFTLACIVREAIREDHPRSRGVYSPKTRSILKGIGSSPLARGLQW